jgi:meiotic recombination protein SPO11
VLLFFASPRLFLRKLKLTLKIPVLALVDSDPYGLKILSVYMKGETNFNAHAC